MLTRRAFALVSSIAFLFFSLAVAPDRAAAQVGGGNGGIMYFTGAVAAGTGLGEGSVGMPATLIVGKNGFGEPTFHLAVNGTNLWSGSFPARYDPDEIWSYCWTEYPLHVCVILMSDQAGAWVSLSDGQGNSIDVVLFPF